MVMIHAHAEIKVRGQQGEMSDGLTVSMKTDGRT